MNMEVKKTGHLLKNVGWKTSRKGVTWKLIMEMEG
jgi:hypothetical protein